MVIWTFRELHHFQGLKVPICHAYVLAGDEAFALSEHVMRPYTGKFLPHYKAVFNYRLSRARPFVACTFGILSDEWRIFHKAINLDLVFAIDVIKCCCVLHNYISERDGFVFEDTLAVGGLGEDIGTSGFQQAGRSVNANRNRLAHYFLSVAGKPP
ncbi:hypothetical protein PR048_026191 [Dryococelus australis]|uniref:DDE Tnp4 domain-containing protein n=1 Tax=Dryococelus australis TaxID=614101 RepID=A0ABQ9GKM8_9NEOP|nr:hypothetical protein PR048_026191 [Dryococelus australis]